MSHACYDFCCLYDMCCCALRAELRLLQLLSPSFFVFCFFPLLVVLIVVEGHNDTLEVPLCFRPLGWLRHARSLL
jgi:hypothetical protein